MSNKHNDNIEVGFSGFRYKGDMENLGKAGLKVVLVITLAYSTYEVIKYFF